MSQKSTRVDAYIAKSADFAAPILRRLREIVHQAAPEIEEDIKWGMPAFMYKGIVANMAAFKNHVSFGFWKGKLMSDPNGLFDDRNRTQITAFELKSPDDIPDVGVFCAYIREAIELNEKGKKLPVSSKKTSRKHLVTPADLKQAFEANPAAKQTFEAFSYTNKKDYLDWISEAKREETRARRLATAIEWMSEGKPRNWKYMPGQ